MRYAVTMKILQTDITCLPTDVIVCPCGPMCHGPGTGGLAAVLGAAAGRALRDACTGVRLAPGGHHWTPAGALPASAVLHVVGPVWHDGNQGEPELLREVHETIVAQVRARGCSRVSVPAISCGVYGYPADLAAVVAVDVIGHGGLDATFCLFEDAHVDAWRRAAGVMAS